jgi:hypothetical protein
MVFIVQALLLGTAVVDCRWISQLGVASGYCDRASQMLFIRGSREGLEVAAKGNCRKVSWEAVQNRTHHRDAESVVLGEGRELKIVSDCRNSHTGETRWWSWRFVVIVESKKKQMVWKGGTP